MIKTIMIGTAAKTVLVIGIIGICFLLTLQSPFTQEGTAGVDGNAGANAGSPVDEAAQASDGTVTDAATDAVEATDTAEAMPPALTEPDLAPPPPAPYPAIVTSIPEVLRRPQKTDAPRYPRDAVIGELGAGDLTREHLDFARDVVRALTQGRERSALFSPLGAQHTADLVAQVVALKPVKFRVGGGKEAADGAFTFLFRILGSDGQIGGEVYFIQGENSFRLDDVVLDEIPNALLDDDKNRTYNLSPYERFY